MSDTNGHGHGNGNGRRRGVHFDPTINLGHVLTAVAFLGSTMAAWYTLDARVASTAKEVERLAHFAEGKADKETLGKTELELSRRILEQKSYIDATQVRIADDVRDMKSMLREGFRDLDTRLDKKADKPSTR